MKASRHIDPDNPFRPQTCICIPIEQRKEELALLAQARVINQGPCVDKLRVIELLEVLANQDDQCSGSCLNCRHEVACEKLNELYKEAFQ